MKFKGFNTPQKPQTAPAPTPAAPTSTWGAVETEPVEAPIADNFEDYGVTTAAPYDDSVGGGVIVEVPTRNVLNSDVRVVGTLRFTDDLLVDGTVEGEIESEGILTVGVNATIRGTDRSKAAVRTRSAIIQGRVIGDISVNDRVELASTAELIGNVTASKISIQDGAIFHGYCKVGNPTNLMEAEAALAPAAAAPAAKKARTVARNASSDNLLD